MCLSIPAGTAYVNMPGTWLLVRDVNERAAELPLCGMVRMVPSMA